MEKLNWICGGEKDGSIDSFFYKFLQETSQKLKISLDIHDQEIFIERIVKDEKVKDA